MKEKTEKPLIRIGEAAALLGIHKDTLRSWGDVGEFKPHHKTASGTRFYLRSDIDEFLKKKINSEDGAQL
jgi:excisionase family DNA binding protein